ncbi:ATP synthase gamma chain [Azospirillaceae bacterium]
MPSLKDLKNRIASVKATQKITSAMKMVAASKLRRAQQQAEDARPYADRMARMINSLAPSLFHAVGGASKLVVGTGSDQVQLLVVVTSDRGLCGAFNSSIVREARKRINTWMREGKTVKVICVGRKGRDQLRRDFPDAIVHTYEEIGRKKLKFSDADIITQHVLTMFEAEEFDVCSVIFNKFKSVICQEVTVSQLLPLPKPADLELPSKDKTGGVEEVPSYAEYDFEPDQETILKEILPRNLSVQIYGTLLESAASEQGARMSAMDNATRNAGDMINRLTLTYNRTRQAYITKELIEIISGAEAI